MVDMVDMIAIDRELPTSARMAVCAVVAMRRARDKSECLNHTRHARCMIQRIITGATTAAARATATTTTTITRA